MNPEGMNYTEEYDPAIHGSPSCYPVSDYSQDLWFSLFTFDSAKDPGGTNIDWQKCRGPICVVHGSD